jgi:hypothetical protein
VVPTSTTRTASLAFLLPALACAPSRDPGGAGSSGGGSTTSDGGEPSTSSVGGGPTTAGTDEGAPDDDDDDDGSVSDDGPAPAGIVVDHESVALFDALPPDAIASAAALRMFFMDRSVGGNIDEGLSCLAVPHAEAPNHCKRAEHAVPEFSVDPAEVAWAGTYDRSNWGFQFWPEGCDEWYGSVDCFVAAATPMIAELDVASFQFSYLAVDEASDIADPAAGFFADNADRGDVHDYGAFAAAHADVTVVYWTTSLARGIGTVSARDFNDAMRSWAIERELPLFDVADILSHAPDGTPCFDNRDGVAYLDENHPDDGVDLPAICPHYTSETEGGHLGSPSAGKIRVAKAYWVLMARIAGWQP